MLNKSLKTEILAFTLGLIMLAVIVSTMIGVFSIQNAGQNVSMATSDTLRSQAKESLVQIAESEANQNDLLFRQIRNDAEDLGLFTKNIYDNPSIFSDATYWKFKDRVSLKDGRYLNGASDVSTVFIPNFATLDVKEKRRLELSAHLDFVAPGVLKNNVNANDLWTVDDKGVTRYYPNIIIGSIIPPDYDLREDVFYKPATPKENPDKKVVWSPLYDDPAGEGLMISVMAPIYTKNGFEGVFGIDVLLKKIIQNITTYKPIEGSYAFLVDKEGSTIAFPDQAYKDILNRPKKEGETKTDLASSSPEFLGILKEMTNGMEGFGSIHKDGKELFVAYAPLKQTGFSLAIVAEAPIMLKVAENLKGEISSSVSDAILTKIVPTSLAIILIASLLSILFITRIVNPIRRLIAGVQEVGNGNFDCSIDVKSQNEIGELATSFNQMILKLRDSREETEHAREIEQKAFKSMGL